MDLCYIIIAQMVQSFESSPAEYREPLPLNSALLDAISNKFVIAAMDTISVPNYLFSETYVDQLTNIEMRSILLAESQDLHVNHKGKLLRVSIPTGETADILSSVDIQYPSNPDRFAIIRHINDKKSFAFRVDNWTVAPHREKSKFGTHSRFAAAVYLEETTRQIESYQIVPIKRRIPPNS